MAERSPSACTANSASALLFFQWRIGFIRRRLRFGALGFAQCGFLVSLSLFLLAASTCRPRSLGSISSVICLKCHRLLAGITHSALYKHVAIQCPLLAQSGHRGPRTSMSAFGGKADMTRTWAEVCF